MRGSSAVCGIVMFLHYRSCLCVLIGAVAAFSLKAQHPEAGSASPYKPKVADASDEGGLAMARFAVPPGLQIQLIAAEPHLANPVAFCFDEQGRIYVAETFRHHAGVGDIRGIMSWLDDELASKSVDDRLGYMKRRLGEKFADWTVQSERVKRLEDRNGDGVMDISTVFAEGFNSALDGIGAGLLARQGSVYYANIPNLWWLTDTNQDGVADIRRSLHHGYGVRIGFLGHDLHGLRMGPDGKLYFSIGDRGTSIRTQGRIIGSTEMGEVFRCNPDGSDLESYAFGLRNPQELAFDQYGNLFTGDNNSDGGDRARWVYVVEGGDSGWRVGYQFMTNPYNRGPFNAERIWRPAFEGQAAYHLPPITNITAGPSGLTFYPGTGLPEKFSNHFFLADFRGSQQSEIHTFRVTPSGASFEIVEAERFTQGFLVTDVEFGVEGGLYASDWVQGWNTAGKGRIYRFHDPAVSSSPIVRETKKLLADGMNRRPVDELAGLLSHPDMRVRQEAQFSLAERGTASIETFSSIAARSTNQLARIHGIWGLGQIAARFRGITPGSAGWESIAPLLRLLSDEDAEIRAQAAKTLADHRVDQAFEPFVALLRDSSSRVRFFAAMGLGKLARSEAIQPVLAMLRENRDQDRYLRHAGVMALTGINDAAALAAAANDSAPAARMGILLALRRLERAEVSRFLDDPDALLVAEAARAINDQPINGAMRELAALLESPGRLLALDTEVREPILRRVINANLRVGTNNAARLLGKFALENEASDAMRAEALLALADWERPSGRDRVVGLWRPTPSPRDPKAAADALQPVLPALLTNAPNVVRVAAIQAAGRLRVPGSDTLLLALVRDLENAATVRVAALRALGSIESERLGEAVEAALASDASALRREGARLQPQVKSADSAGVLTGILANGAIPEKQNALAVLSKVSGERPDEILGEWMDQLMRDEVPAELQLDILEAAMKRGTAALREKISKYEASMAVSDDPMRPHRIMLSGGDAAAGRKTFVEHQAAACFKCHKVDGEGGEVGPELTGIGGKRDRAYILESILFPNNAVAEGFESVVVTFKEGGTVSGVFKSETETELMLNSAEDGLIKIKKAEILKRERGLSAMPEGITGILTRPEIRDIVEFLTGSK